MNQNVIDVGLAAVGFGLPCLVAVCRTRLRSEPRPPQPQPQGFLVTRFRVCHRCDRSQVCAMHSDGSFTCLTCNTTQPPRTNA